MEKLIVEVWSDISCPFCYIGKRNYEKALEDFTNASDVVLEMRSFQLDPHFIQQEGAELGVKKKLANKYRKSIAEVEMMLSHITESAKNVGLHFKMDEIVEFNSFNAHRVLQKAITKGLDTKLSDAFHAAHFENGEDLGNEMVLKAIALKAGLTEEEFNQALTEEDYAYKVKQDIQEAANLGITGVPFFVFNRKYGVSGAQPQQVFLDTLKTSFNDWKANQELIIHNNSSSSSCDLDGNCE
ncbi:MAG: DsbA family oxidoreductase [Chitinophagales bacterium]|nr:DsbA family oxidoreductase [Chitinophagales bacterium]MCZ2393225.1 DsbA family oxidoreductase [Chitinophagales bacterium]